MDNARPDAAGLSAITAVVVDDDSFALRFMEKALGRIGVGRVHACLSAPLALRAVSDLGEAPVLLVCDLNMPEMDGIEFLRAVAQRRFRGSVLILSGADETVREAATKLATAYGLDLLGTFAKPVAFDKLADAVLRMAKTLPTGREAT